MMTKNVIRAQSKGDLFKRLYRLPKKDVRNVMNSVISENRNVCVQDVKYTKTLTAKEVRLVLEYFDELVPEGH